jgi:hypothetical protein
VTNATVRFTSTSGSVTVTNSITDSSGNANATLTLPNNQPAGTITLTATDLDVASLSSQQQLVISSVPKYALGVLSSGGTFTNGSIAIGQTPLAAGGTSSLSVNLVDTANGNALYSQSASVSFTSPCISSGNAKVSSPVVSATGTFQATYTASGCSGNDTITATATVGSAAPTATGSITVQSAALGSIQFTAPTQPTTIGLRGTGQHETAAVTFTVVDANGNPLANQTVNFSLTTTVGGLTLTPTSAVSAADGTATTTVQSGTVHTVVQVVASVTSNGSTKTSQSNYITVSTGYPAQNSFSLSASQLNMLGDDIDGITSTITARLSDRYKNPVPDGTQIAFTAEGGSIGASCATVSGSCSVTFTSANPRTRLLSASGTNVYNDNGCSTNIHNIGCDDHRYTILATAIGEESFNDCYGSGLYSSTVSSQCPNGDFFQSLPEAFLDSNENGVFNGDTETYIDFDHNGAYTPASGKFIGLLCSDPNCDPNQTSLNVRQSLVIVMASSTLTVYVGTAPPTPAQSTTNNVAPTNAVTSVGPIPLGGAKTVYVTVGDSALQTPPVGTTIGASMSNGGSILAPASYTVPNTDGFGYVTYAFVIQAPTSSTSLSDQLVITATNPNGTTSSATIPVSYSAPAAPVIALSPTRLVFQAQSVNTTSASQPVTLSNTGNAAMALTSIATGTANFAETDNCGSSVAAGSSCTINVTFTPAAAGTASDTLTVTTVSAGNATVALSGTGR